jgi:prepilin-type N-terminal cleavage/methylation domain-containing protein
MPRRVAGFTLIELLITIAMVAILSLVVAPSFVRMVTSLRLQGVGNELASDLQYVRSEAASRNLSVRLVTRSDGRGYSIATVSATPQTLKQVELPAGFTLTTNATIQYDPLRAMTVTARDLVLDTGRGPQLQVSASESGQVQMCSPNGSVSSFRSCAS